jgi:hypothetical protein
MKAFLIGTLVLMSISSYANDCSFNCTSEGKPGLGASAGQVVGEVFLGGSRAYGTWVKSCEVTDKDNNVYYSNKISGSEVTQIAPWGSENAGDRLNKKRERKEKNQALKVKAALEECNLNI